MNKIMIIGLDGATWDVILPLVKKGYLPTFKSFIENGSYGELKSTIPPVTGGAWLALASGMSAGKTGIIDFLNRKDKEYNLATTNSADFKNISIWDKMNRYGKKVGIYNYPMLYPPYKINGFMISGLGSSPEDIISYPPDLIYELETIEKGYKVTVNYHNGKYDDIDIFLNDLNNYLEKQKKWLYYLIENKEWDLFFGVISATDWIQHIMWKYIDEKHPDYSNDYLIYKEKFNYFWKKIDEILSDIESKLSDDTSIFIVSDHGFGPNDQSFNLVKWLVDNGYMKIYKDTNLMKKNLHNTLSLINKLNISKVIPKKAKKKIYNNLKTKANYEIDFENSIAYCLGHTIPFGAIYVKGSNEKEKMNNINKIKNNLYELQNYENIKVQIFETSKIFTGEKRKYLPEIIFTINNWRCIINEDKYDKPLFENKPYSNRHTGSHRLNGIFIAKGPNILENKKITNAEITDIAPTIQYMAGIPINNKIDGKVIENIFNTKEKINGEKIYKTQEEENIIAGIIKLKKKKVL